MPEFPEVDLCETVPASDVVAAAGASSLIGTTPLVYPPGCVYDFSEQDPNLQSYVLIQFVASPDLQRTVIEEAGGSTEDVAGVGDTAWGTVNSDDGYDLYVTRGAVSILVTAESFAPDPKARAVDVAKLALARL